MTREEQIRLLANIRYDELTTKDALTRIVSALPVSDPAPVADTTELEAAVGELERLDKLLDGSDEQAFNIAAQEAVPNILARVRAAMGRKA